MNPIAILGAIAAAALGAVGWALISWKSGYEIGYVAWAVGGLVGVAAVRLGGWGRPMAVTCALLATLSIFAGKMAAVYFAATQHLETAGASREDYDEMLETAAAFAKLKSEDEYAAFMVKHQFTGAKKSADVDSDDIESFKETDVPLLKNMNEHPPPFEEWKAEQVERKKAIIRNPAILANVTVRTLNIIDAVFALLGIGTAFRLVMAAQPRENLSAAGPGATTTTTNDAGPVA